jgi:kinesin family protein 2/24
MKSEKQPKILVTIRKRPLTKKEKGKGENDVVLVQDDTVCVNEPKEKVDLTKYTEEHRYKFDRVYDQHVSTEQVP